MSKIKDLTKGQEKVYIILKTKESRSKFMADAEKEGITFSDGTKLTDKKCEDIMALYSDGKIRYLGWAGRILFHYTKENLLCIDYDEFVV